MFSSIELAHVYNLNKVGLKNFERLVEEHGILSIAKLQPTFAVKLFTAKVTFKSSMAKDKKSSVGVVHVLQGKRLVQKRKKLQLFAAVFSVKSNKTLIIYCLDLLYYIYLALWKQ